MKVSVIIPAYNHEKYIGAAIESVLRQTFHDFELIIINDGSIDNTAQVILGYKDPRIQYFPQKNQGAHHAINRGISLAQGEYISILNSDDLYHPERLDRCLHFLETNKDHSVVITCIEGIDSHGNPLAEETTKQIFTWVDILKEISGWMKKITWISFVLEKILGNFTWLNKKQHNYTWWRWYNDVLKLFEEKEFLIAAFSQNILVSTSNFFMRREVFDAVGMFRGLRYAHDWDMLLRIAQHYSIQLIKESLLHYRVHEYNTVLEAGSKAKTRFEVNWLIAENIRTLSSHVDRMELFDAIKNNVWISLEILSLLLMINDEVQRLELLDITNPLTVKILQSLQHGNG
jgi:glycosyltransferase involved in cell wall biosynthesis